MDGGHRDEDDPLDPPNRLDRLDLFDRLDQLDRMNNAARPSNTHLDSHSLLPQPPSDRLDANLSKQTLASPSPRDHHHIQQQHLHHNRHAHALQPSLLPSFDVPPPPAPPPPPLSSSSSRPFVASNAGVDTAQYSAKPSSQPFPPFPAHHDAHSDLLDDPGDFYRSYTDNSLRGHQQDGQDTAVAFTAADLMAPETPVSQPAPLAPSHNTSPNGVTIKQMHESQQTQQLPQRSRPTASLASRTNAIRSGRSVSTPVGSNGANPTTNRSGYGPSASSSTSVKDLKKRFDQINTGPSASATAASSSASSSTRLKPTTRTGLAPPSTASRSRATTAGSNLGPSPTATTRAKTPTNRTHAPPPVSSPNSFASRIAKPRAGAPGTLPTSVNEQASKSTPHLTSPLASPRANRTAPPPAPPPVSRANGLLFGEILPEYNNSLTTGYGIDAAVRPRRTSESVLHDPPRIFTRSRSEMDQNAEAVSPTDWYRSATSPRSLADQGPGTQGDASFQNQAPPERTAAPSRSPTGHIRAHSDLAGAKPTYHHHHHKNQQSGQNNALAVLPPPPPSSNPPPSRLATQNKNPTTTRPPTSMSDVPQSPTSPTSRLPISVRKLSEASNRSSPSSTRSNSPASAAGRRSAAASRVPRQQHPQHQHGPPPSTANAKTPAKRAATPTSTAASRAKAATTPTSTSSRRPPPSQIATSGNGRLSAYIAAPPPKLSPPLRSSRPRQPVSSANAPASASRLGRTSAASSSSSTTAERSRMPYAGSTRSSAAKQDESRTANRRKIDVGPIDFAQRRETIRLKYSKSIRETEASAARQAAADRRKKELEAAAKAKALAEAAVRAQSEVSRRAMAASAATLSSKSSASSLSASSNAAASTTTPSAAAAAAVARSHSVRSSTASVAANAAVLAAASSSSPTASRFPGTSTPPPSSPTAATAASAAAAASAAVSTPPRNSPRQSPLNSPGVRRTVSVRNSAVELPPLAISTSIPELRPAPSRRVPRENDSPTLGIPGTFPGGVYSPPRKDARDEPPPSAISVNSAITEFDNEPQTDPPRQDTASGLQHAGTELQPQPGYLSYGNAKVEYRSPFDLPTPDDQTAHTSHHSTPQKLHTQGDDTYRSPKSSYMYPFEDEGTDDVTPMANNVSTELPKDANMSPFDRFIPGSFRQDSYESRPYTPPQDRDASQEATQLATSLHQSPVRVQELRRSDSGYHMAEPTSERDVPIQIGTAVTETPDETAREDIAIGFALTSSVPTANVEEDSEPTMPSRNIEPEYEVQPYQPDKVQTTTTVTILGRETDIPSRRPPLSRLNSSSSRLDLPNDSDYGNPEGFYAVPTLKDNIAALRGSAFASSDISDEPQRSASEPQRTPDTSNSLNLPSLMSPANRSSQQSGWTDFSIESEDARAFLAARDSAALSNSTEVINSSHDIDGGPTIRTRAVPPSVLQNQQSQQNQQSEQNQQRLRPRHRRNPYEFDSRPASVLEGEQEQNERDENVDPYDEESPDGPGTSPADEPTSTMLPELDTGTNFFVPYLSDDKVAHQHIPVLPDHDPPPIPVSVDGRESFTENSVRPSSSSAYYDSSRPNSFALGMRDDHDGQDSFTFGGNGSADDSMYTSPPPTMTMQSSAQASLDLPRQSISGATLIDSERPSGLDGTGDAYEGDAPFKRTGGSPKKTAPSKEQSRLVQRQMVIRELIDTEAVFVRDMNIVEEIYKGTAEACPQLDAKTVKLIFRNTDEIIAFHTAFLVQLKDAVSTVYAPKGGRRTSPPPREDSILSESDTLNSTSATSAAETTGSASTTAAASSATTGTVAEDARDRQTSLGPVFRKNIDQMRVTHEAFLRSSDNAAKRLIQIQEDPTVKLWLTECNEVAQDLTAAWNLDSLLIKPMQRITKYPNLISQLLQYTPEDHPDRGPLISARTVLENSILEINKTKKNFELVGQIVGRKRKDSDVRAGFARAFGKRVDKLQVSSNRPPEDQVYTKLNEKFGDDYLRLQVVLRDVEFYTRQVSAYVHEFLQLLSAMELVMRLQPSPYPELESKWARFNVSMRDMEKVALDQHLAQVRKHVIEPFELVIKCYGNPSLAMKKRAKRRLDYERAAQLKKSGKKVDKQLAELVEQYEALNEALKKELPMLSANTEKIGNICLGNFVNIQVRWFAIWKEKVKVVLEDQQNVPEVVDIMSSFARDFHDMEDHVKQSLTILTKGAGGSSSGSAGRADDSQSSPTPGGTSMLRTRSGRPMDLSPRGRGESVNSDSAPTLPAPDFGGRASGPFAFSPTTTSAPNLAGHAASTSIATAAGLPSPHQYYYRGDYYSGLNLNDNHARSGGSGSPGMPAESSSSTRSLGGYAGGSSVSVSGSGRPSTGRSYDSSGNTAPRPSVDSLNNNHGLPTAGQSSMAAALQASKRDSGSTYNSSNQYPPGSTVGGDSSSMTGSGDRRFSGLFHSAMPMDDIPAPTATSVPGGGSHHHHHHHHHHQRNHHHGGAGGHLMADDASRLSSRAPSRERAGTTSSNASSSTTGAGHSSGYNVLWLAASLFEFNIETKHEAGYPYLTYQAGEIFDVIAEKGELWLAKNQDDPSELVGWIWSKHFAKLADS
ncbi:Rho guanyl nucleotide exchange [Sporothrix schenckii 1099-18]|uniref:Rho guanyl nucleotide exchange n=1 Tax=Sporothrix schenckii 1099-18 TaxID=1397361 RepID=A0A0F2MKW4_SPOSC|nr:Rho guanyl nucleotide exchange [Sporothrix schenckii 1099-18]KJR89445.1 Rho guanyl nucleotide exchange [Sporothrix schenckii 1099-18]